MDTVESAEVSAIWTDYQTSSLRPFCGSIDWSIEMIETQIKESLAKLKDAIAAADAEQIKQSIASVDAALAEHRREINPQVRHFLKNRSYMKALDFLNEEKDIPKGRCGGRKDFS